MARKSKSGISKSKEKIVAKTVRKYYHGEQHSGPGGKPRAMPWS